MTRVGGEKIPIPSEVKVTIESDKVLVQGPRGSLQTPVPGLIRVEMDSSDIVTHRDSDEKEIRALHGLTRSLLANAVIGVTEGFSKELDIVGIGYRAAVKGKVLSLSLGFSHSIEFSVPEGIEITVQKDKKPISNYIASVLVSGNDKQRVGQVAADIRTFRPPDAYKGKGIRYADELVRVKVGKKTV
ncbi:MAG: 50S ribosomal protein L6 [Acidobacteriota bacterium]|nr:50S ribosomal protein L6 [Acidobacteriota bacterium]